MQLARRFPEMRVDLAHRRQGVLHHFAVVNVHAPSVRSPLVEFDARGDRVLQLGLPILTNLNRIEIPRKSRLHSRVQARDRSRHRSRITMGPNQASIWIEL